MPDQKLDIHMKIAELEKQNLTPQGLERLVMAFEQRDPDSLTDSDLLTIAAITRLHRRSTAGPSKSRAKVSSAPVGTIMDMI